MMARRKLVGFAIALLAAGMCAAQQAAEPWVFDVASIRPTLNAGQRTRLMRHPDDAEFGGQNVPLTALLQFAYGVSASRILGLPARLEAARFDVQAKPDAETDARFRRLASAGQREAKQKMVQALLVERCGLKVHMETRELPVFALVVGRGGVKFGAADAQANAVWAGRTRITVEGGDSMARLAEELSRVSGRPVVDRTGMTGHYDIEFEWAADDDDDEDTPKLFTAIREQLGLQLEPQKAQVEVVVIDRMDLPSEN